MAWYRCGSANNSIIETNDCLLKFMSGTSGSVTYTIEEDGIYLMGATYSLDGSGSIALPMGRTASYSGTISNGGSGGLKLTVAELQKGDTVTVNSIPASWLAHAKFVIKVPVAVTTLLDSAGVADTSISYNISSGSGNALCVMSCYGKWTDTYWDRTYQNLIVNRNIVAGVGGVQTAIRVFYYDVSDFPTITAYGYDGGGVKIAILQ